jgi:hypothetical protein
LGAYSKQSLRGVKKKTPAFYFRILLLIFAGVIMAGFCGLLAWGFYQVNKLPVLVDVSEKPSTSIEPYVLSESQTEILRQYGNPHSFSILFYTVTDAGNTSIGVRDETWTYYDLRKTFQFINGELSEETAFTPEIINATRNSYNPQNFSDAMDLSDVISANDLKQYLEIPLEDELVPNSRLYYANRLTFALQNGRLRYVESLPLEVREQ